VLDSKVDTLLDVPVLDFLVNNHTHAGLADVVDNASLSVIDFVRHSLLYGSVGLDIDDISNVVRPHVSRQLDHALLLEVS